MTSFVTTLSVSFLLQVLHILQTSPLKMHLILTSPVYSVLTKTPNKVNVKIFVRNAEI